MASGLSGLNVFNILNNAYTEKCKILMQLKGGAGIMPIRGEGTIYRAFIFVRESHYISIIY